MHKTALDHGSRFFNTYAKDGAAIVDIGAQDVNGSLRTVAPASASYVGVDFATGKGVDVVIDDPYRLPFEKDTFDIAVSSSCFEHSEFFWLSFLEILRVLKPSGLLYLNVPSNGMYHRHPVDCWRFYPDSGKALERWAHRNNQPCAMLESFTGPQDGGIFNDFVAVFVKDESAVPDYPRRMIYSGAMNGFVFGSDELISPTEWPEDQKDYAARQVRTIGQRVRSTLLGG